LIFSWSDGLKSGRKGKLVTEKVLFILFHGGFDRVPAAAEGGL
jgi:hypothetical protein